MNTDILINWFESRRGKLTYSMNGSRNGDRKSTRLNSSHSAKSRMPSSA